MIELWADRRYAKIHNVYTGCTLHDLSQIDIQPFHWRENTCHLIFIAHRVTSYPDVTIDCFMYGYCSLLLYFIFHRVWLMLDFGERDQLNEPSSAQWFVESIGSCWYHLSKPYTESMINQLKIEILGTLAEIGVAHKSIHILFTFDISIYGTFMCVCWG